MKIRYFILLAVVVALVVAALFWGTANEPISATASADPSRAILKYLEAANVALNFRPGEETPYQAWVSQDCRLLILVSEIQSIEGLTVSYSRLDPEYFEHIVAMPNLKHLCVYGDYSDAKPGDYDYVLDVLSKMTELNSLSLGNASFMYTEDKLVSLLESLKLEKFGMFRTSLDYINRIESRFPNIYDHKLDIPFTFKDPPWQQ